VLWGYDIVSFLETFCLNILSAYTTFYKGDRSDRVLGDILMLSEGVRGVDNVFSLRDGMLTPRNDNLCGSSIQSDKSTF
jgi:hypothetical protein